MKGHTNNPNGRAPVDIRGQKYNRLTAIKYIPGSRWLCLCDCGKSTVVATGNLTNGHVKSCGCLRAEIVITCSLVHGHAKGGRPTPTWHTWKSMLRRCNDPSRPDYYLYGARGISVCARWCDFRNFLKDMGEKPKGLSIGRKDNNLGYSPENCRWEDAITQGSNKRNNHLVTVRGETKTVSQWARLLGVNPDIVFARIRRGWPEVKAVTKPLTRIV